MDTVTQKEKMQLGQTLEAIMRRLDAMEARPTFFPQVQPLLSPAAPQFSWTQGPWTQTQTTNLYYVDAALTSELVEKA